MIDGPPAGAVSSFGVFDKRFKSLDFLSSIHGFESRTPYYVLISHGLRRTYSKADINPNINPSGSVNRLADKAPHLTRVKA